MRAVEALRIGGGVAVPAGRCPLGGSRRVTSQTARRAIFHAPGTRPAAARALLVRRVRPPPPARAQRRGRQRRAAPRARHAPRLGLEPADYLAGRRGTAATLRALDAAAGGGFFAVPPEAELDDAAADAAFASGPLVVDVQTHLVRPSRSTSVRAPTRCSPTSGWWIRTGGAAASTRRCLSAAEWAACVFGGSDTAVALLTSPPGRSDENVLTNDDIARRRDDRRAVRGTGGC